MDWRGGSNNRVPVLQGQSPKFKPQFYWKKKVKGNPLEKKQFFQ
jgi:hypothetical protein